MLDSLHRVDHRMMVAGAICYQGCKEIRNQMQDLTPHSTWTEHRNGRRRLPIITFRTEESVPLAGWAERWNSTVAMTPLFWVWDSTRQGLWGKGCQQLSLCPCLSKLLGSAEGASIAVCYRLSFFLNACGSPNPQSDAEFGDGAPRR